MALKMCPDCGTAISTEAKTCVKCGRSMIYWTWWRIVVAIVFGIILFNTIVYIFGGGFIYKDIFSSK